MGVQGRLSALQPCPDPGSRAGAAPGAVNAQLAESQTDVAHIATGGLTPKCGTSGEQLLDFWDYKLSVGQCIGILFAFYAIFHVGSYLALSKLYRQKR